MSPGAGPVFTASVLAWGIRPEFESFFDFPIVARHAPFTGGTVGARTRDPETPTLPTTVPTGQLFDTTHAAVIPNVSPNPSTLAVTNARYLGIAITDANTGALVKGMAELSTFVEEAGGIVGSSGLRFGAPGAPASHPVPRSGDRYTALDLANGDDVDIQTISWPAETTLTPAPSPITTSAPERMPAWSPDGIRLGFVRTANGRRTLVVFDATPGIQNALNAPSSRVSGPGPAGTAAMRHLATHVTRILGVVRPSSLRVPIPLGRTVNGVDRFRWNGEVAGRRLTPGTYLLTYRALKKARVLSVSGSIRVTVAKGGKVVRLRPQK